MCPTGMSSQRQLAELAVDNENLLRFQVNLKDLHCIILQAMHTIRSQVFLKVKVKLKENHRSKLTSTAFVPWSIRSIFVRTPNVLSPENLEYKQLKINMHKRKTSPNKSNLQLSINIHAII